MMFFNLTIKKKIFIYMCSLITISFVITSLVIYFLFFRALQQNEMKYALESSHKTKQNIEFVLNLIDNTGTLLGANQDLLNEFKKEYNPADRSYYEGQNKISTMLKNIISVQEYIKGIYILSSNGNFYTNDWGVDEYEFKKTYQSYFANQTTAKEHFTGLHEVNYHSLSNSSVISYIRPIFDINSEKYIGTIIIDINYELLKEIFTISSIQNDEKVLVIDRNGEKILNFPYNISLDNIVNDNPMLLEVEKTQLNKKVFGKESIIISNTIDYTDWKIIRIVSSDKIYRDTNKLKTIATYISVVFIIISLSASLVLSSTLTKPITELTHKVKLVEKGDLTVNVKVKSKDELGQLSNSFNNMVVKLKDLINKLLEEQKKKSDMEFQILQAQINPHFLYNTLDSIKWLAVIQNINNISDMATALINLLKYNISRTTPSVTLEEEIESVKNYIKIQKYRYGDIFSVKYNVQEETLKCTTLRFILQPIVENAIFHGFESVEGNGIIQISTKIRNGNLIIEVTDNGSGIDDDTLKSITEDANFKKKFSGIGVQNINERIKLYFGKNYGLCFSSELNEGTKVTLTLPVIFCTKEEEYCKTD
ncbi:sensor histidine kinase [Petroclostridium sp. X23]|uniref:cache domain-containing sensor histidine kinase n=1 Tax=Petroclostridium sp. X23 TaxID=3045146 RepID=UPI0024ACF5A7|nr:sensor histidine kinase [Petroclostridium sp. X23]WHH61123.1 sensor histidine kinase [Petroclostridium sp. X23]